jgi:hypothetical protein
MLRSDSLWLAFTVHSSCWPFEEHWVVTVKGDQAKVDAENTTHMTRPTATNVTRGRRDVMALRVSAVTAGRVTEFMNPSLAAE